MKLIVCEECKKRYDCEKDDFCPKCGAYNQPVKTWTTDAQGNVRRVDGVNEANHAASFVHSEVHRETRARRARGLDWNGRPAPQQKRPQPAQRPGPAAKGSNLMPVIKAVFWIAGISVVLTFLLPLLMLLLNLGA